MEKLYKDAFGDLHLPTTTIAMVADHIEHIRDEAGVEHIGLGSDFDGNDCAAEFSSAPRYNPHWYHLEPQASVR